MACSSSRFCPGKVGSHDIVDLQRYLTELMRFCDRQRRAADLNADQLQFVVTGAEEMDTAALYIACYDRAHRMTHVQCELLSIETDRGQSITLERTPAHSICVFLLERGTNVPISPKTVIEMRP